MRHLLRLLSGPSVLALAVVTAAGAPASAEPAVDLPGTFVEHWQDEIDEVFPDGDPGFCGDLGFSVRHRISAEGTFVGTVRGDGLWHFGTRFHGTETITNPLTGHVLRRDFDGTERDQQVTDNGDGTLTVQVQTTGPNRYSLDGRRIFADAGMTRFTLLVDDGGTPGNPEDDGEAQFVGIDTVTGLRQTLGRDFCADIAAFLG